MSDEVEAAVPETLFTGDSQMAMQMRSIDWSQTPLGAVETWTDSLKTAVQILLAELDQTQPSEPPLNPPHDRQTQRQTDAFRVYLRHTLHLLTDANEIQGTAARILGESLNASRVIYIEVLPNGKEVIVHKSYTNGVAELSGVYNLEDFGRNLTDDHRAGRTAIVPDVEQFPNYTDSQKALYRSLDIAAHMDVPLIKNDQFVALLVVHQNKPRSWTEDELKQVEETAAQTWAAVERSRAEAASRESRAELEQQVQKFKATLSTISDFVFSLDRDGRFLYANQVLLDLWGVTAADAIGKTLPELNYPPAVVRQVLDNVQRVFATGEVAKDETPYTNPAGVDGYFEYILSPVLAADGTVESVAGSARETSERKQVEKALRQSEEQTRNVLESIAEAFFALDEDWRFTYVNRSARVLLDRAPGDLIGKTLWEEYPGIIGNELELIYRSAMRDRVAASITAFYPDHDRWYEVRTYPAPNGITVYFSDVTEQIQTEAALRQSEERYRTLFESIDQSFCLCEMLFDESDRPIDYRFLEVNPVFETMTGLQNVVGKTARELVPNLETQWFEIYGKVVQTGEAVRFEDQSAAMNQWFDVNAFRVGEPQAHQFALLFTDTSARKRAEGILRRAAEIDAFRISLSDALRPLADPVEIQATASRVLGEYLGANRVAYFEVRGVDYVVERDYVNGAAPLAGQYPIDSFGPKLLAAYRTGHAVSVSDVEADPHLSPAQQAAYAAIEIGAYIGIPLLKEGEFVAGLAIHASGSRDWTADEIFLAEEVAERTWSAVERARAEASLRDSENRFRMAIESAQLGTWDWNLVTNQLIWDDGCKAMFGLPPEAESSIDVFFQGLHPDDRDRLEQVLQWVLNPASGGKYDEEYRTIGIEDGVERWIAAKGQAYFDTANNPQRFVGTVLNITQQKRIEAEREQLFAREQAARETADRANQIKDEFLAVLSHELRSPLNPILGWAKLLQQGKLDTAKTATALTTIERNAQLQVQLIDDLLDISRILRGKLNLTATPVDFTTVILEALETVRLAAEAKAIQIETTLLPSGVTVIGDAGRLQQVMWNLLSNAVKFTPHQGQVTVTLVEEKTHARIQVSDTGKGIRADYMPHVFEHFWQEDGAITRKFGGLGLGLAIARQIVELHGGTVTVDSPGEGQGATFTVCIPLSTRSPVAPESDLSSDSSRDLSDIHILVVDDDTDSREFVAFALEQSGAIVTPVASAMEALQAFYQSTPDIIVSDIGMPEMDGYMLMRQISRLRVGERIPAIALTAYAGEMDQQKAIAAGFQRHLAKPIEPGQLAFAVATLVKRARNH